MSMFSMTSSYRILKEGRLIHVLQKQSFDISKLIIKIVRQVNMEFANYNWNTKGEELVTVLVILS